jgi:hypothetical protein
MTPQPTTDDSMQQSNHSNGSKTVVIPIHAVTTSKTVAANEETVDDVDEHEDDIPEWTMLELNGELLPPIAVQQHNHNAKENEFHPILGPDGIELGSLQFLNKVLIGLLMFDYLNKHFSLFHRTHRLSLFIHVDYPHSHSRKS